MQFKIKLLPCIVWMCKLIRIDYVSLETQCTWFTYSTLCVFWNKLPEYCFVASHQWRFFILVKYGCNIVSEWIQVIFIMQGVPSECRLLNLWSHLFRFADHYKPIWKPPQQKSLEPSSIFVKQSPLFHIPGSHPVLLRLLVRTST